jgi:predicted TPR repeat methyltransferase
MVFDRAKLEKLHKEALDALLRKPESAPLHLQYSMACYDLGLLDESAHHADRCLELTSTDPASNAWATRVYLAQGRRHKAATLLSALTQSAKNAAEAAIAASLVLQGQGQLLQSVELIESVIDQHVGNAELLLLLGHAYSALGDLGRSVSVYGIGANATAYGDAFAFLAASAAESASKSRTLPAAAPNALVRLSFALFSVTYDNVMNLRAYRVPRIIEEELQNYRPLDKLGFDVLDLGCGTGLVGASIRKMCVSLVGVDLSIEMLKKASCREIYDELHMGDAMTWLQNAPISAFDVVTCAGPSSFLGDLHDLFKHVAATLREGGIFCLLTEKSSVPVAVRSNGNFLHSRAHVVECASKFQKLKLVRTGMFSSGKNTTLAQVHFFRKSPK